LAVRALMELNAAMNRELMRVRNITNALTPFARHQREALEVPGALQNNGRF
jgi:hypothetical protein